MRFANSNREWTRIGTANAHEFSTANGPAFAEPSARQAANKREYKPNGKDEPRMDPKAEARRQSVPIPVPVSYPFLNGCVSRYYWLLGLAAGDGVAA